ncbi:hypothetical protein V1358_05865 [Pseudoalteromonas sp. YIC-656]|uniref:hypothetical protein n=1 Tax=Pseudoalteromonas pernae TaxID=3118054 RepID=UPI003242B8F1
MDNRDAKKILEQIARNLVAIENLSRILSGLVKVEDRKLYTSMLKELISSNFELQELIGRNFHNLHPSYLGLETFRHLKKKYEDPEHPISLPCEEDLKQARSLWERLQDLQSK